MKRLTFLLVILIAGKSLHAQDTLPKFSVKSFGNNRIVIGWVNNYSNIKQISIQRSFDSLTGFKTIASIPDPTTPQNGYVDAKATTDRMFYRLYIMLDKGVFLFSDPKRPTPDTARKAQYPAKVGLPPIDSVAGPNVNNTKPKSNTFMPSLYVFTNRDGYVRINLPDDEKPKKYSIKFFEDDGTFIFELKEIKEQDFKLDKTNFYHAGWFRFELYEDGKLFEKHKFYIEKDF